jgi:fibronectin type 3 domain-containing protein
MEIDMNNKFKFDFGISTPCNGFIKITGDTLYDHDLGYGIEKKAEAVIREIGEKVFARDLLKFSENSFKVKLENGIYNVRIYTGDYGDEGDVTTRFDINGTEVEFWIREKLVLQRDVTVEVTNSFLSVIALKGKYPCINAIEIAPKYTSDTLTINVDVTALVDKQFVTLSWDKADVASGYKVIRKNMQNNERDKIEKITTTSWTDYDVSLCENYEYTVAPMDDFDFVSESAVTLPVYLVDGGEVAEKIANIEASETENSVALSWTPIKKALYYNVYKKAPYGLSKKIASTTEASYVDNEVITSVEFIYSVEAITTSGATERIEITNKVVAKPTKRMMETLDRGLVAIKTEDGIFLSWRLNGYEYDKNIDFLLYRNGERITKDPITDSTNYLDKDGVPNDEYTVKAVKDNKVERTGYTTKALETPYIPIALDKPEPFTTPDGNTYEYTAYDISVADLDGDGEYELVLKWMANPKDNSHKGYTGVYYIDAYKLNGTKMWRINLGVNIREGHHYCQLMVYDFNNDGKAEVICKTADGTIDGIGNVIGDINADYRNKDGFILEGPEFLTVFNGETGAIIDTVDYDPPRGNVREWGDSWGNRVDRFLACVAYLDGVNPSVVMCRGYYDHGCPTVLVAYDLIDNKLVKRWKFLANKDQNIEYTNQGNHHLGVGDVDGDGLDEIVYGAMAVDHDGKGMYSTGLGHGDAINLGKFTTKTESLDFFQIHEHSDAEYGYEVRNPATGEILWGKFTGRDTGRGLCAKIDPRYEGNQVWVKGDKELYTFDGEVICNSAPETIRFAIWWDGDLLRELLDYEMTDIERKETPGTGTPKIYKWNWEASKLETILNPVGTYCMRATNGTPCIQADIFGDWREEVIWPNEDSTELRIYTTSHLTDHKFYTLMHDPVYRLGVAWQNVAYNQPPHTGFYIGDEMEKPPVPMNEYVRGENIPDFQNNLQ